MVATRRDQRGTLYTIDVNLRISDPTYRRGKWLFDRLGAVVLLLLAPLLIWFVRDKGGFFRNAVGVVLGRRSWVGYHPGDSQRELLPPPAAGSAVAGGGGC